MNDILREETIKNRRALSKFARFQFRLGLPKVQIGSDYRDKEVSNQIHQRWPVDADGTPSWFRLKQAPLRLKASDFLTILKEVFS